MKNKIYIDSRGNYLGVFTQVKQVNRTVITDEETGEETVNEVVTYEDNPALPVGAIEIQEVPTDLSSQKYNLALNRWEHDINSIKNLRISSIKSEAARRISSAYPEWRQTNYIAAVTEINNKEIVAMKTIPFVAQYQLTAEELQTLRDADTCKKFITAIRTKSNTLERSLDNMTSEQLAAFDPSRDSHWQ